MILLKIIYSLDVNPAVGYELEIIKKLESYGYEFTLVDWVKEMGLDYIHKTYPSADEVLSLYRAKDPRLMRLYDKIRGLAKTHDVLIACQSHIYTPEFVDSLKDLYTVFYSADDPDSSEVCSHPYVKHYDHVFAAGVNFDETTKITDKFLEWGAKRADWWPLGFRGDTYDPGLNKEDILEKERPVDVMFVGSVLNWKRLGYFSKLKRAFPQMKICSRNFKNPRWKFSLNAYMTLRSRRLCWESYLPHDKLSWLYQNSKIGINMHFTYGPSNIRTYQLNANGVMQVCDCLEGLDQVYKVGKEVEGYQSIDEAIDLIRYYLDDDNERRKIAAAGFIRAIKDYNRETTFLKALDAIKQGIDLKG